MRTHQRRGSNGIVARLGRLGRIVRLVPRKVHKEKSARGCRGGKTVVEKGRFVSLIAFAGSGFTRVHAHEAVLNPPSPFSGAGRSAVTRRRRRVGAAT
jgi:hypothetical protein